MALSPTFAPMLHRLAPGFGLRRLMPAVALAAMVGLSGCVTESRDASSFNAMASLPASSPSSATLAFDSIDGPPQAVFDSLVRTLDTEAHGIVTPYWYRIVTMRSYVKGWKISPSHYLNQDLANIWLDK